MYLYSTEVHKMPVAVILQWIYTLARSVENIITVCLHALSGGEKYTTALNVSKPILSDKVDTQAPVLLPCYLSRDYVIPNKFLNSCLGSWYIIYASAKF